MDWIEQRVVELEELSQGIESRFGDMAPELMDRKPASKVWSLNECFDHLIQANRKYYDAFDAIAQGTYSIGFWSRLPFFPRWVGRRVVQIVSPDYKGKNKTAPIFFPLESHYQRNVGLELVAENRILIEKIQGCRGVDLDHEIVVSPVSRFVTYSLRDCIHLLVNHEKRHFQQALRLAENLR